MENNKTGKKVSTAKKEYTASNIDKSLDKVKSMITAPVTKDGKLSYTLRDSKGKEVGKTYVAPGTDMSNIKGKLFTQNEDGTWTMHDSNTPVDATVSLDKATGKITVSAPDIAIKNETFRNNMTSALEMVSEAYKLNPEYKFTYTDESGENKEKSIDDIINELNAPIKDENGIENQNSVKYLATAATNFELKKDAFKQASGFDFTDKDIVSLEPAAGPDVKDNTPQLISDLPEAAWLRNVITYDKETGTAQYKDIMENAYNKEKTSSEEMIKLWAALENYFEKGNFKSKEEYIKNVATVRFLDATQPNMSWIRDVTENVKGFLDGIGGYATDLGSSFWVWMESLPDSFFGGSKEYKEMYGTDYSNVYIRRGGNQFDENMPLEKVDAKIGKIKINEYGVPTYTTEKIEGSIENPRTTGEIIRAIFKENQAVIRKDIEYLHASQSAWDAIGYAGTQLAALISAGNYVSNLLTVGAGVAASAASRYMAVSAESLADTATSLFASGSALGYASRSAKNVEKIVSGIKTIYDIAQVTGKSAKFLNFIGRGVASAKATEFIFGVFGESIAEAIVGDPNRFVEVLENEEIDDDTKNYLITTYVGNALGWGIGIGTGKFLIKAGETVKGRAISANLTRHIFKIENAVGDAFDRALLSIRRVGGDTLEKKILELYGKEGKYAKKQASALTANLKLREMRKAIADMDAVKISGKSKEEIEASLKEIEKKILELQNAEVSLNSMQRQGQDIVQMWLKDDGSGLKSATSAFYENASKVAKAEQAAGDLFNPTKGAVTDLSSGKTLRLFSQTTTNYIKASEKIDYINAYIKRFEHAADATKDTIDNIRKYKKELPELQEMVKTFTDNATAELKLAADNFIDADRKWWSQFETLRAKLGLTDKDELLRFRGSKLWGTNGELYARTTRKADLSEYVIRHRDGAKNIKDKTFDLYENYMAGASGDFADPMGEMQIALYDAGNKQAYRSFVKSYDALTGSLTTKVSSDDVELLHRLRNGLEKSYYEQSVKFLDNVAEDTYLSGHVEKALDNIELKNQQTADLARTSAKEKQTVEDSAKTLDEVTSENAGKYIQCLDAEDTAALWDNFYSAPLRDVLAGEENVPENTKRFIYRKAKSLGVSSAYEEQVETYNTLKYKFSVEGAPEATTKEKLEAAVYNANQKKMKALYESRNGRDLNVYPKNKDGLKAWYKDNPLAAEYADSRGIHGEDLVKYKKKYSTKLLPGAEDYIDDSFFEVTEESVMKNVKVGEEDTLLNTYDRVVMMLNGTEDSPDFSFENAVKRSMLSQNENVLNDSRVQKVLTAQRQSYYEAKLATVLSDVREDYAKLAEEYGTTVEELNNAGRETIEAYIEAMTRPDSPQRKAIDELCEFYGVKGDQNAIRYFALSAFVDQEGKYKKKLYDKIEAVLKKKYKKMDNGDTSKIASILTNGIAKGIEEEYNDAYLVLKEVNENAVHEATEKVNKEVTRIANEIEEAESNRFGGAKNIIVMRNMQGKVEYYETDPLLARLVNFEYKQDKMNGLTQAIYNTNYLWAKLFRLGTTAINIKSMMSQMFRDPINMFIGGGAYRTGQQCVDDILDVVGDDIAAWYKTYEPEVLARIQNKANKTGADVNRLLVEREMDLGKAISPASTETNMYKSLKTAKSARFNGVEDIYDDTLADKAVRKISNFEDRWSRPNEWRETTLRNLSYSNGFAKAIKRGYTIDEARTYATFVMNEATTNFTRMTNHLTALKDTVPYFGSAINGTKSFFKLFSMDPVGVAGRLIGGLIIPMMALTSYSLMSEENRKIYKGIPEYQKEDAVTFVVDGQIVTIPVPQELGSFLAPFRQLVEGANNVSTNTFFELAFHNILGFSPVDLTGFADLDFAKLEQSSPGFLNRISRGVARMWSQLAPAPLKSGLEVITGVDPYTGKEIDKSRLTYDENGNQIIVDYQSGELATLLNNMFRSWGLSSSAPVVQNIITNIVGQASVDILDFLVSLGTRVPSGDFGLTATEEELSKGEKYNPFYVLTERLTSPLLVDAYDEAQSAWKSEVAKLYNMKDEILRSDAWEEYLKAKKSADDPEALKKINSSKKDLVENYFNAVKNSVINLQKNYGAEFTPVKYATVLSLMTMNEQTLDAGSYGKYLQSEEFKTARSQAIQTMINMGFQSSSMTDILGRFETDNDGNIKVATYNPLAILQLDDPYGASLRSQSNKHHFAVIRELVNDAGIYDEREKYYKNVNEAYDAKDYNKVEKLINAYNEKVIRVIAPYIKQYTPESVLQGDTMDFLEDYIMVPSSFMGKGKYYSSKTGLNKQQGYARNYIKSIFGYGENKTK